MAGNITTNVVQLGDSATASQNFHLRTNVDGILSLNRGNVGASLGEIFRVTSVGSILATNPAGVVGYGTGAGGTVTQATSKSTAVTLNTPTGQIIMNNAALAAGASVFFNFNNSVLLNGDVLVVASNFGAGLGISEGNN